MDLRRGRGLTHQDKKNAGGPQVSPQGIARAQQHLAGQIERTPCKLSRTLSAITGADVWVKFENLQFTASFKERGALNRLLALSAEERARGVIAMSAGNHAQGVAYHAGRLGIPATIVMPKGTPFVKIKYTEAHGASVIVTGDTLAEAAAFAHRKGEEDSLVFVHPYDDPLVIEGQGTIAAEMLEDAPELDCLIVPIGGGGLISGIATAARAINPDIEIFGVESSLYPGMSHAVRGESPVTGGNSIAEGIAVKDVGKITMPIVRELVSDIILVPEEAIEHAIALFLNIEKTVAEGAGAAGLAALIENPARFRGRRVGLVLCGGNIDPRLLTNVIMREMIRDGRVVTLRIEIPDRPGQLAVISRIVADEGANVIEVVHQRMLSHVPAKSAELNLTIETLGRDHSERVVAALKSAGFVIPEVSLGT